MADAARAGATPLLPGLPDEIVVWEILVRLPPKALPRCRAVRRAWGRATSTRDFLLAHHAHQPTLPLLDCYNCAGDVVEFLDIIPFDHRAGVDAADQLQTQYIVRLHTVNGLLLQNSCDGLLVFSFDSTHFAVCNPSTRQLALLPQLHGFMVLGMYPHSRTGEYRLLLYPFPRLMLDEPAPDAQDGAHVFALGSDQPPRHIGCPEAKEAMYSPGSVLFSGSLHWYIGHRIMVFDTIAELFRLMRCPIVPGHADLFEMGDMLGMSGLNDEGTSVEIWVTQDYEGEVWSLKYRVELPIAEIRVQFGKFQHHWEVVATSWDDDVIVLVKFDDWLLQVDMDGQLVAGFHHRGLGPTRLRIKQSLVSHTFFPTRKSYFASA